MIESICQYLMKWCERRGKVLKITGSGGEDDIYLIRYYVLKSKWYNIFIHQFLRSDRDDMHDHPWNFVTYLVKGSYLEKRWNHETQCVDSIYRANYQDTYGYGPVTKNRLVFRKATDQHQVVVDCDLKEAEKDQAALTLFVSGPTKREWGFVREGCFFNESGVGVTIREWVPWREYLGLAPDEPGRG